MTFPTVPAPDPATWFKPGRVTAADLKSNVTDHLNAIAGVLNGTPGSTTVDPATAVVATATAYPAANASSASIVDVDVVWVAPTNADGSPETTIAGYQLSYALVHPAPGTLANPAASLPLWTGAVTIDGLETTISKLPSGDQFSARVRTLDGNGNHSPWTYSAPISLPLYVATMTTPSAPVVDCYLGVLRARWDGLDATGASMLANSAFDHVLVEWSTSSSFSTIIATNTLNAAGSAFLTTAAYGTTYYCRFTAVSRVGNTSTPTSGVAGAASQVVSADLLAGCVGSVQLANLAVLTANIGNLAVNDAQIGSMAVGKLTAGTLSAQVLVGNQIATATSGARCVFDSSGIHLYNSAGGLVVDINTSGTATFSGSITGSTITGSSFQTAASGARISMGVSGSAVQTLTFVDASGNTSSVSSVPNGSNPFFAMNGPGGSALSGSGTYLAFLSTGAYLNAGSSGGFNVTGAMQVSGAVTFNGLVTTSSGVSLIVGNNTGFGSGSVGSGGAAGSYGAYIGSAGDIYGSSVFGSGKGSGSVGAGGTGTFGVYFSAVGTGYFSGNVHANGTTLTSTIRHKYDVKPHDVATDILDRIRLVTYRSTHTAEAFDTEDVGVIAEELLEHADLARFVHHEDGRPYSVDYTKLTLAAVVSLNAKLDRELAAMKVSV